MIKSIVVDMDGTFLDDNKEYNRERFLNLYQKMLQQNVQFVVASGNQYLHLIKYFPEIADEITFIAENGAFIVEKNQIIFEKTFTKEKLIQILNVLENNFQHYQLTLSGKTGAYVSVDSSERYKEKIVNFYQNIQWIHDYHTVDDAIFKLALNFPAEELDQCVLRLQTDFANNIKAITSGHEALDIIEPNLGKEAGVRLLQKRWQLAPDEMAAFGDNMNDFELLQSVKYGYAMDNGRKELKDIAFETIGSNNSEAVLDKIEELLEQNNSTTK